jgi:hypothetical protein
VYNCDIYTYKTPPTPTQKPTHTAVLCALALSGSSTDQGNDLLSKAGAVGADALVKANNLGSSVTEVSMYLYIYTAAV